jgi:hypothetical protein
MGHLSFHNFYLFIVLQEFQFSLNLIVKINENSLREVERGAKICQAKRKNHHADVSGSAFGAVSGRSTVS